MKRILFQGDSITDAGRTANPNPNGCLGLGYPLYINARLQADYPGKFEVLNRGITGNRVVDLYARWKVDCLNLSPDILSILIGVNDTWHEFGNRNGVEPVRYARIYHELIEWTQKTLPKTKIIILEPFIYVFEGSAPTEAWRAEIDERRAITAKLAKDFGLLYLPCQKILNDALKRGPFTNWLHDGVHPAPAGHQLITDEWIKAVKKAGWL